MTTGLFIGLALNSIVMQSSGYTFVNAEAAALVARFTTAPTNARKALIDTLVGALKASGAWAKRDAYYFAGADAQATRRNWIADAYNLTAVSSPVFTADRGYTGDGVAAYLDTGFNPVAGGIKYLQNNASMFMWSLTTGQLSAPSMGVTNALIQPRTASDTNILRLNAGSAGTAANTDGRGLYLANRTAAGASELFRNGVSATTSATASVSPGSDAFWLLGRGTSMNFAAVQIAAAGFGSALTSGEQLAEYNAIRTYLQAIGAVA